MICENVFIKTNSTKYALFLTFSKLYSELVKTKIIPTSNSPMCKKIALFDFLNFYFSRFFYFESI